jgi:DNA uptake protein ComE-like DNA-binding protein
VKTGLNLEPVKNWLGFTRRERRSTSILLSIIVVIIAFRYLMPEQNISVANWGGIPSDTESAGIDSGTNGSNLETGLVSDSVSTHTDAIASSGFKTANGKFTGLTHRSEKIISLPAGQRKSKVDLNRCDTSELIALPGIGSVLSVRIIKYRNLLGGFSRVEQLKEVYGLSGETYELIRERCFADTAAVRRVPVNSSEYKELCRIPYLEKYEVSAILKYRELKGRIGAVSDLTENNILTKEKADKVGPYMDFR